MCSQFGFVLFLLSSITGQTIDVSYHHNHSFCCLTIFQHFISNISSKTSDFNVSSLEATSTLRNNAGKERDRDVSLVHIKDTLCFISNGKCLALHGMSMNASVASFTRPHIAGAITLYYLKNQWGFYFEDCDRKRYWLCLAWLWSESTKTFWLPTLIVD